MTALLFGAVLFAQVAAQVVAQAPAQPEAAPQQIHLAPGEYRWIPLTVKQTPTAIACKYQVLEGNAGVHAELLTMREFRLLAKGLQHESLATTREGQSAEFRRIVGTPGQYAAVISNRKDAQPAVVSFDVRTEVDPASANVAQTLPARRKLAVILISFALFFVTVVWSGILLTKAIRP